MPARGARTYKVYARSIFLRNQVYGIQSPAIDVADSYAHSSVLPKLSSAPSPFFYFKAQVFQNIKVSTSHVGECRSFHGMKNQSI